MKKTLLSIAFAAVALVANAAVTTFDYTTGSWTTGSQNLTAVTGESYDRYPNNKTATATTNLYEVEQWKDVSTEYKLRFYSGDSAPVIKYDGSLQVSQNTYMFITGLKEGDKVKIADKEVGTDYDLTLRGGSASWVDADGNTQSKSNYSTLPINNTELTVTKDGYIAVMFIKSDRIYSVTITPKGSEPEPEPTPTTGTVMDFSKASWGSSLELGTVSGESYTRYSANKTSAETTNLYELPADAQLSDTYKLRFSSGDTGTPTIKFSADDNKVKSLQVSQNTYMFITGLQVGDKVLIQDKADTETYPLTFRGGATGNEVTWVDGEGTTQDKTNYSGLAINNTEFTVKALASGSNTIAVMFTKSDRIYSITINGDTPSAINAVNTTAKVSPKTAKVMKNGKLIIVKDGKEYNAAGAQIK